MIEYYIIYLFFRTKQTDYAESGGIIGKINSFTVFKLFLLGKREIIKTQIFYSEKEKEK